LPKVFLQYSLIILFCLLLTIFLLFIGITFFLIRLALSRDILKLTNSPQELFTLFKRIFILFNILDDILYSLKLSIFIQRPMIFFTVVNYFISKFSKKRLPPILCKTNRIGFSINFNGSPATQAVVA